MPTLHLMANSDGSASPAFAAVVWSYMYFPRSDVKRQQFMSRIGMEVVAASAEKGGAAAIITPQTIRNALDAGPHPLDPRGGLREYRMGVAAGFMLVALRCLSEASPCLCTKKVGYNLLEWSSFEAGEPGNERDLKRAFSHYMPVAHFWAALLARGEKLFEIEEIGYTGLHDFALFLHEAEDFRKWGENWVSQSQKSSGSILDPQETIALQGSWNMAWGDDFPSPGQFFSVPIGLVEWAKDRAVRDVPSRRPGRPRKPIGGGEKNPTPRL